MEAAVITRHPSALGGKVIVIIPARNEEPTVGDVVRDVREVLQCEVLVVDDGSTDRTAERAVHAGAQVLTLPFSLGAWGAAQAGLRYANANSFDIAVTLDADGQHHAESVPRLLHTLVQDEADVAIGACPERLSIAKHMAWSYFRWLTRLSIRDFTSGLRAYNRRALAVLAARHASLLDYQDVGVLMLLNRRGLRVSEVPVNMSHRQAGRSRVFSSWFAVARYMMQTTVLCISRSGNSGQSSKARQLP